MTWRGSARCNAADAPSLKQRSPPTTLDSPDRPTCLCGHDRYHHAIRADLKYGGGGWLAILNGASGTPREITFRCAACGEVFETTTDPVVLKQYRRYPYVERPDAPR